MPLLIIAVRSPTEATSGRKTAIVYMTIRRDVVLVDRMTSQALLALAVVAMTAPALDQPLAVVLDRPPLVAALVALLVAVLEDADSRQFLV